MNILIIGACGSGKTWVAERLAESGDRCAYKKIKYRLKDSLAVLGVYDGSMFQGSDRLSMAVASDFEGFVELARDLKMDTIAEGDRFTNSKWIKHADPIIIRILGDGAEGRSKRGSDQSARHIKSIQTRVDNIKPHFAVKDSEACLKLLREVLEV